jgi:eukaryotic-like serine/threonine-protein kinase
MRSHPYAPAARRGTLPARQSTSPLTSRLRRRGTLVIVAEHEPGTVIAGKFRIDRRIGEGGMGVVLAATHLQLDEAVALKFLRKDVAHPELAARFTQEARAAVKLKSEYVARTYDVGVELGDPYIVMEFLDGHDLGQALEASGTLPIDVACTYLIQACAGVAEAHARGIVHRDIKPENIFIAARSDGSNVVKILDFGISHVVLADRTAEPRDTQVVGSPYYISPEQLRPGEIDYRVDIWSLGAVLFELLAGVRPFDAPDMPSLLEAIRKDPPRKLSDYRPMVPRELELIVNRCLEKDPSARFPSAGDLAVALLRFASRGARVAAESASRVARAAGMPAASMPPSMVPPGPSQPQPLPAEVRVSNPTPPGVSTSQPITPPQRRGAIWIGSAAALALAISLIALVELRSAPPPPAKPTAAVEAPKTESAEPVATVAAAAPLPSADPSASASAPRRAPAVVTPQWRPRPSAPSAAAPPAPRPSLEIHMTR